MQSHLTSEDRLCLLLARGTLSQSAREEALELVVGPLQWDQILERAKAHAVYPLLYRNLKNLGFPCVPDSVRAELEALFRINALRNSLFARELAPVLGALHCAGIPVIPLKGLLLAESLYGDISLRVCADMDILVPRRNVTQAFDLLVARGYVAESPKWFLGDGGLRNNFEFSLSRREGSAHFLVELHWGLLVEAAADEGSMKYLWAEAHGKSFLGVPVYDLNSEWQLLFLATHAARHNWQGLKWLVDIHELCRRRDLAWDRMGALARQLGWEQLLQWSLSACHRLLETPLPPGFVVETPPFQGDLFPAAPILPTPLDGTLTVFLLAKRPSEKLRIFLRRLFTPSSADWRLCPLPSSLTFLYYVIHPLRLAWKLASFLLAAGTRQSKKSPAGSDHTTAEFLR